MRIFYIANARIPTEKAHGVQIMKMCEAFSDLGHQVELLVPFRFNKIKDEPFSFYGVKKSFRVRKIFSFDLLPLEKYLGKAAFFIQNLSFVAGAAFYALLSRADLIFCRDLSSALTLSFFKNNVCFEVHDSVPVNFWTTKFFKNIFYLVSTNNYKKEELIRNFEINSNNILVAPNGVDLEKFQIPNSKFQIRGELGLPLNKKIILYTGHLYKWKGTRTLIEAVTYLTDDYLIVFVGGTKEDLSNVKCQMSNVRFVGFRPHREIPFWLKAADALALPNTAKENISKYETSPIKLFEYMASGTPIVASDLPSVREIINESNSVLVEADNPKALSDGIQRLLTDSDFSNKISAKAFSDVQRFTWRKRALDIMDILEFK